MNKLPAHIFKEGPNKSIVICHSDLGGCSVAGMTLYDILNIGNILRTVLETIS